MPNKVYPFNGCIKLLLENLLLENKESYKNGNFGLWFNKFIPISEPVGNDKFQACGKNGEKNTAVDFYNEVYVYNNKNSDKLRDILKNKHWFQYSFYKSYEEKYEVLIITAELISPLITGIGQTHPNEVGMTFDHTLGIPYIPASSIKGVVRFSHTLGLLGDLSSEHHPNEIKKDKNNEEYFDDKDDEAEWTNISEIFGKGGNKDNESNMGNIIFLDAYPESVPNLSVDIMNPHFGEYYSDNIPPADYLKLNPIKFLTVAKGTKFIFRYMINKAKSSELMKLAKAAIEKALTEEGIGAKTAVGYGLFKIEGNDEPESVQELIKEKEKERKIKIEELAQIKENNEINNMPEVDKICYKLRNQYDESMAQKIYSGLDSYNEEDKIKIVNELKEAYIKDEKWKNNGPSKKQKEKIKKIESILNK